MTLNESNIDDDMGIIVLEALYKLTDTMIYGQRREA